MPPIFSAVPACPQTVELFAGSVPGQISNAYTAAAESINAAVAGCRFNVDQYTAYVDMLG